MLLMIFIWQCETVFRGLRLLLYSSCPEIWVIRKVVHIYCQAIMPRRMQRVIWYKNEVLIRNISPYYTHPSDAGEESSGQYSATHSGEGEITGRKIAHIFTIQKNLLQPTMFSCGLSLDKSSDLPNRLNIVADHRDPLCKLPLSYELSWNSDSHQSCDTSQCKHSWFRLYSG